jgi:diguanylate cyclase (GGDEF)-like protein
MRRRWASVALVLVILIAGTAASATAADYRRSTARSAAEHDFRESASGLSAQISTEVRRAADLMFAAGTYVATTPDGTNAAFERWFGQAGQSRQSAALGLAFIQRVTRAELPRFLATRASDASSPYREPAPVSPATDHDEFCLPRYSDAAAEQITLGHTGAVPSPLVSLDVCAFLDVFHRSSDAGELVMTAFADLNNLVTAEAGIGARMAADTGSFSMVAPVYSGVPASLAERRTMVVGWLVGFFDGPELIRAAVAANHGDISVRLTWRGLGGPSVIASTPAISGPTFRQSGRFRADGAWEVALRGSSSSALAHARAQAWEVFGAGMLLTVLLASLFFVIIGSRDRALRLVARRTEELHHQVLHDGLTGLPNRVLALDRAEQMLVSSRRDRTSPAALFLDIDDFKTINDTLGHGAGDELLRAVASRLRAAVRASETVARLGGDEFVVLVDGRGTEDGPELVAQRILDMMAEPFHLAAGGDQALAISFSVGVAIGDRDNADELLRDADIALYQAKAAGKARFVVFAPDMRTAGQVS